MPELPEVETVRRGMEDAILGQRIDHVKINRYDLRVPVPQDLGQHMTGRSVHSLVRRGKYIILHLDSGHPLIIHLGMSGRVRIYESEGDYEEKKHDHILMRMSNGKTLAYEDSRRFGMFYVSASNNYETSSPFSGMGPEPLDQWGFEDLILRLKNKKSPIKNALLDQYVVSGLGNIYVCEALHKARISPLRKACDITENEAKNLVPIIQDVLRTAIKAGGSTLKDYQHTDGSLGYFQHTFTAYDREGDACSNDGCHGKIERIVQSGRSTFYCPACQK